MAVPERTCVGCRRRRPQSELVRCVLTADGRATVDRRGAGRGAWLCAAPAACFRLAVRRKAFQRAWRRPVDPAALDELAAELGALDGGSAVLSFESGPIGPVSKDS